MAVELGRTTYNRSLFHGGDLQWAQAHFAHVEIPWLDLSTGINPCAYPVPKISLGAWQRLPGTNAEKTMLEAARNFYDAPPTLEICAAPGTQLSIQILPRLYTRSQVDILAPTYSEHAASWKQAGHQVREIADIDDISEETRFVVVVRPNNPDGTLHDKSRLLKLTKLLQSRNGQLIVDEAFADTNHKQSLVQAISPNGPIVLKSFGKFFGLAGLRLGFCLGPVPAINLLQQSLGPWIVSGVAMEVATKALKDSNWISQTRYRLKKSSERLSSLLSENGLDVVGKTSLFCLAQTDSSDTLFRHLCEQGILCRMFPERAGFLRFGLPGTEEDWQRISTALNNWQNEC
ncbi:MAG: threonine-phosphate decarboxylase CobD [Sneathiella sp.]|uniref:threonine-phosphate decarboxylase CobD n=1 Tax=Sneathiella sp. TaxID=1964365 RepID=UPI0030039BB0